MQCEINPRSAWSNRSGAVGALRAPMDGFTSMQLSSMGALRPPMPPAWEPGRRFGVAWACAASPWATSLSMHNSSVGGLRRPRHPLELDHE